MRMTKRVLAALLCTAFFVMLLPAATHADVDASLTLGVFDETTETFKDAAGSGAATFSTLVIGFALSNEDAAEAITLPSVAGYTLQPDISSDYSKIISISPAKTAGEIAEYIRRIGFNGGLKGQKVAATLSQEVIQYRTFYWGGNGHYYQYVPFGGTNVVYTWINAYNTAKSMTYNGRTGYLATVTSKEEDLFLFKASTQVGWLGGTRLKHTGTGSWKDWVWDTADQSGTAWYWACGPEAGNPFYNTASITAATYAAADVENAAYYFNWERGGGYSLGYEPNSGTRETCLATLTLSGGQGYATRNDVTGYSWNDLTNNQTSSGGNWDAKGFFVEYGDQINGDSSDSSASSTSNTVGAGADIEAPLPTWMSNAGLNKDNVDWNAREETLRLKEDIGLTDSLVLPDGANLTLNLDGKDLTAPANKPAIAAGSGSNGVDLRITDTATGGGSVLGSVGSGGGSGSNAIDFSGAGAGSSIAVTGGVSVVGGQGGDATAAGSGGNGGAGIVGGSNTTIHNAGTVTGGAGGSTESGSGGNGGAGISGGAADSTNTGTVGGGRGGDSETGAGGNGGDGMGAGANTGTVKGGNGGNTSTGSVGRGGAAGVTSGTAIAGQDGILRSTSYTITYNKNNGGGTMANGAATPGTAFALPACAFTAPAGMRFKQWAIGSTTGTKVAAAETYTFTANTTVYALWEDIPTPTISEPTADRTVPVAAGRSVTLSVTAADATSYQWWIYRGSRWAEIPDATGASYTTSAVTTENSGYRYYCVASNDAGDVRSHVFTLNVTQPVAVPQTGDSSTPMLWLGLMLLAGAGLTASAARRRRRHN